MPGAWERYWSAVGTDAVSPWDADQETQTPSWVDRIGRFLTDRLPLVDVACGSGAQTWMLAKRFSTVVGVDISPTAIERARRRRPAVPGVCFQVLDILDERAVSELAGRIGPANVWLRFLLHHLENDETRLRALAGLGILTGGRGRIFNYELLETDASRRVCVGAPTSAGPAPRSREAGCHDRRPKSWVETTHFTAGRPPAPVRPTFWVVTTHDRAPWRS